MTLKQAMKSASRAMEKVADLILDATSTIENLKLALKNNDFGQKDEDVRELASTINKILATTDDLYKSIDDFRTAAGEIDGSTQGIMETKMEKIGDMREALRLLSEFLSTSPGTEEFKEEALDKLLDLMNDLIAAANSIHAADAALFGSSEKAA